MTDSYNELIAKQDDNQKVLIHDIKNHMITLNEMCAESSEDEMREYIRNLIDLPGLTNIFEYTKNKSMNIILSRYKAYCKKYNIDYDLDVSGADISFIDDTDITALFCNALDNAVEAAIKTATPFVDLKIKSVNDNAIVITLKNSCERKPEKNSLGRFISSKQDPEEHGLGTLSMQRVAKRYNGNVEYHFEEATNTFHTVILLYKGGSL
ncbi:MAG: ATP-binding protein [Wujia sp.]